jgi:hypothetical protein
MGQSRPSGGRARANSAASWLIVVAARAVVERRREPAIRSALGTTSAGLVRLVIGQGLVPVVVGAIVGLLGAYVLGNGYAIDTSGPISIAMQPKAGIRPPLNRRVAVEIGLFGAKELDRIGARGAPRGHEARQHRDHHEQDHN